MPPPVQSIRNKWRRINYNRRRMLLIPIIIFLIGLKIADGVAEEMYRDSEARTPHIFKPELSNSKED